MSSPTKRYLLLQSRPCVLRQAQDEVLPLWHLEDAIPNGPHPEPVEGRTILMQQKQQRAPHDTVPRARSLKRWILPVAVFGSSSTNSIQRGYLYGAILSFTKAFSSSPRPAPAVAGSL